MPYERNTTRWPVGALVIHAADAKRRDMLMRVVRYRPDGCAVTRYAFPSGRTLRGNLPNDVKYLLDPARFGIDATAVRP
jgi:hypothetical protein